MGVDDSPISLRTRKVTVMPYPSNLELSVTNFGPIAKADIDLRPMTVFVGPSNTGKSYLAILMYALHKFFTRDGGRRFGSPQPYTDKFHSTDAQSTPGERIQSLIDWANLVVAQANAEEHSPDLGIQTTKMIGPTVRKFMEDSSENADLLDREVARCFGIENTGGLIRHRSRGGAQVNLNRRVLDFNGQLESFKYAFTTKKTGSDLAVSVPDETPLYVERVNNETRGRLRAVALEIKFTEAEHRDIDETNRNAYFYLMEQASKLALVAEESVLSPFSCMAHYLPAGRTGVMQAHRVAVGSLIARAPYGGLQQDDPLPVLSGVLADFLRQLSLLGEPIAPVRLLGTKVPRRRRGSGNMVAGRLEEDVLRGSVHSRKTVAGYPVFSFRPEGWKDELPLMNVSSMVSELAPVVLYLRHVVSPGEVLIIEEPESHLHPAMQVEFTRHLAAAVRAGVRVMITTHSEWVLDELANLVRLSELPETRRQDIGGADYSISPEQLGVWLFEPKERPRGSVVKEIPFDEEFGGFRSGFDEVAIGTYNDYAAISNRVEQGKPE